MDYPVALALTLVVEVPVLTVLLTALGWPVLGMARWWSRALLAVAVNLLTHPVLWWWLGRDPSRGALLGAELVVWLVEAGLIVLATRRGVRGLGWAVLAAGCANGLSYGVGAMVATLFDTVTGGGAASG